MIERQKPNRVANLDGGGDQVDLALDVPLQETPVLERRRVQKREIAIKGPVHVMDRFVTFCNAGFTSYWSAIEALLDHYGAPK